jgi:hypothetical protein
MKFIIGIDDTDNLESRGTGFRARELGLSLMEKGYAKLHSITRHQLLFDRRIPYTSHNSAASIIIDALTDIQTIIDFCSNYLLNESAEGSDAGLCVSAFDNVSESIIEWGNRAKKEILTLEDAHQLADKVGVFLKGFKGLKIGVIGSLAAVGLRKEGNDGRLLWTKNLRETQGIFKADNLVKLINIDRITDKNIRPVLNENNIFFGEWSRPVLIDKQITLIVEEEKDNEQFQWKCASKEYIKSISQ